LHIAIVASRKPKHICHQQHKQTRSIVSQQRFPAIAEATIEFFLVGSEKSSPSTFVE
jgi:hypothetical protein